MEPMKLSFGVLMAYLNRAILQMQDPRKASNGNKYTLKDAVLGAFSMFFMQSRRGKSNAQSLFGMINLPTVSQIRNIIDGIAATAPSQVFTEVYQTLRRDEHLKRSKFLEGLLNSFGWHSVLYFSQCTLQEVFDSHSQEWNVTCSHSAILPNICSLKIGNH
jgi:hypothetical protein